MLTRLLKAYTEHYGQKFSGSAMVPWTRLWMGYLSSTAPGGEASVSWRGVAPKKFTNEIVQLQLVNISPRVGSADAWHGSKAVVLWGATWRQAVPLPNQ